MRAVQRVVCLWYFERLYRWLQRVAVRDSRPVQELESQAVPKLLLMYLTAVVVEALV
jgi:hypothetical protein